jgi:hypothetical protein
MHVRLYIGRLAGALGVEVAVLGFLSLQDCCICGFAESVLCVWQAGVVGVGGLGWFGMGVLHSMPNTRHQTMMHQVGTL